MQEFLEWNLDLIRSKEYLGWVEEYHLEWSLLIERVIPKLLAGYPLLILSDTKRRWFVEYILLNINSKNRPFIPVYKLEGIIGNIELANNHTEEIEDMLSISFPKGYIFWYIGEDDYPKLLNDKNTLFWIVQNSKKDELFFDDENLDIKLIELYRLLDRAIEGAIFGEFRVDEAI